MQTLTPAPPSGISQMSMAGGWSSVNSKYQATGFVGEEKWMFFYSALMVILVGAMIATILAFVLSSSSRGDEEDRTSSLAVGSGGGTAAGTPPPKHRMTPAPVTMTEATVKAITEQTAAPSARSFVACTIGVQGVLRSAYPLDEQLCDEYIFTEVVVDDSGFWSRTSNEAFKLFKAVASERRRSNSQEERFCLSLYDNFVAHDMAFPAVAFSANAVDMYTNSGISCYGLLNQVHSISALAGLDVLRQSLTAIKRVLEQQFPAENRLFLGLGFPPNENFDKDSATALFDFVKEIGADELILVTHVRLAEPCRAKPSSSWMPHDYGQGTSTALSSVVQLVKLGWDGQLPLALSLTLAVHAYWPAKTPPTLGDDCEEERPLALESVCAEPTTYDADDMTVNAVMLRDSVLLAYEDARSVRDKVRAVRNALSSDGVVGQVGWAFFELPFEDTAGVCAADQNFPRVRAARQELFRTGN